MQLDDLGLAGWGCVFINLVIFHFCVNYWIYFLSTYFPIFGLPVQFQPVCMYIKLLGTIFCTIVSKCNLLNYCTGSRFSRWVIGILCTSYLEHLKTKKNSKPKKLTFYIYPNLIVNLILTYLQTRKLLHLKSLLCDICVIS